MKKIIIVIISTIAFSVCSAKNSESLTKKAIDKNDDNNTSLQSIKKNKLNKSLPFEKKQTKKIKVVNKSKKDYITTQTRNIQLNSSITDKSITYEKHWYKPFPSDFKISINDQEYISLQNGQPKLQEKVFTITKNKIKVAYEWTLNKFGKHWHTEKKEMEFEIPPNKKKFNIKFSWEKENRILIDHAKMIMCSNLN